jgi:hypothetical protein
LQREMTAEIFIPIIFITAHGEIPLTVRAIKAGAVASRKDDKFFSGAEAASDPSRLDIFMFLT